MSNDQHLFLIEFLVDRVNVPSVRAINENVLPSTTYVSFQILNLPVINIYQDDNLNGCTCPDDETQFFRKGKSCLFALPTSVLEKPLHSFPITMSVFKKLPQGVLPDVMLIGSHQIEMKDLINSILKEHVFKSGNSYKAIKDTFKITTATGQLVGNVTVFIRASCYGKKIITQFQIPCNKKPYLFKGADDSPVFACNRISSSMEQLPSHPLEKKQSPENNDICVCGDSSKCYATEINQKKIPCPPPPTPTRLFGSYTSPSSFLRPSVINSPKFPHGSGEKKCGCP